MTKPLGKLKLHKETVQALDAAPRPDQAAAAMASAPIRCFTDGHFTCVC